MTHISLPFLDADGNLTPLVIDAMANGATSDRDPNDTDKIILTFSTKTAAKAFVASIATAGDPNPTVTDDPGDPVTE